MEQGGYTLYQNLPVFIVLRYLFLVAATDFTACDNPKKSPPKSLGERHLKNIRANSNKHNSYNTKERLQLVKPSHNFLQKRL